jgi:DNA-binding NarL/FixJ family response regulator/signal transduction histidine kinase
VTRPPRGAFDTSLWRALGVYRTLALGYALVRVGLDIHRYAHPVAAVVVGAAMTVWTAGSILVYRRPAGRRAPMLALDMAVAVATALSSRWIESAHQIGSGAMTLPTVWASAPVIAWAAVGGWLGGLCGALVVSAADFAVRGAPSSDNTHNDVLLVLLGVAIGYVATLARDAEAVRVRALRIEAVNRERQRLARDIHDSVLQVLALVQRRGTEAGGEAAELGRLAGEQERALRALVTSWREAEVASGAPPDSADGDTTLIDLRELIGRHAGANVSLAAPDTPVWLPAGQAGELAAAVGAALDNVRAHAPGAHAWLLIEDDADEVVISVRDDGPGLPPGRLDVAAGEGRRGVAQRHGDVGGRAGHRGRAAAAARDSGVAVNPAKPPRMVRVAQQARSTVGAMGEQQPNNATGVVPAIRVMVVDDHPMWRDAVARDLTEAGYEVVATAGDGREAVRRALTVRPRVVVLDMQMPELTGAEATARLVAADPGIRVLVLSASGEQHDVLEAVKAGATGYLVKSASRAELIDAVRRTAEGEAVFTPGLAGLILGEFRRIAHDPTRPVDTRQASLTERETEVLRLVAKGLSYKQIAERLVLSHRTVQNHVQNTLNKLHLHNRVELARYAIDAGLD